MSNRFCIICGMDFNPPDPDTAICPDCGGPPERTNAPVGTVRQPKIERAMGTLPLPAAGRPVEPRGSPETASGRRFLYEGALPLEWDPGDIILDLYEVRKRIESGGMAIVYQVHHRTWNLDLAVKAPRINQIDSKDGLNTFIAEAEAWIGLGLHPHIVACHYVRRLGNERVPRVFAEWVSGGSLSDWIKKQDHAEIVDVLDIAIQFAWGLAYAHGKGLVHKDVKPDNVLLAQDGTAKVTDFGLANARGNYFTPAYASPEQVLQQDMSLKTDIWSWAVSILHLLLGDVSWHDGTIAPDVFESHLEHGLALPVDLVDLLRTCFRSDPAERPDNMLAIADRLETIYESLCGQPFARKRPLEADLRAGSFNNRALSLLDLEQEEQAKSAWEQALAADPRHLEATYNLGLLRWRRGLQTDVDTVQQLETVAASHTQDWHARDLLSWVHLERGDPDGAEAAIDAAHQLAPDEEDVLEAMEQLTNIQAGRSLRIFEGHEAFVRTVAVTQNQYGPHVLSGAWDKTVRLWTQGGDLVRTFRGHRKWVSVVTALPDGFHALSGGREGELFMWRFTSSDPLHRLEGHSGHVRALAVSPDGQQAISGGSDDYFCFWDLDSGKLANRFERPYLNKTHALAFLPDGRSFLAGTGQALMRWDLASGERTASLTGHTRDITGVAVSPDGTRAVTSSLDMTVRYWDLAQNSCLSVFKGHTSDVTSVAIASDGKTALSGGRDGTVRFWEVDSGVCRRTFEGHTDRVDGVAYLPNGRWAVSASSDLTLRLWGVESLRSLNGSWALSRPTFSGQAQEAAEVFAAHLSTAREKLGAGQVHAAVAEMEAAQAVPGYERDARLMDLWHQAGVQCGVRQGLHADRQVHRIEAKGETNHIFDISGDGKKAVIVTGQGSAFELWDLAALEMRQRFKVSYWITELAVSEDGGTAVAALTNDTLSIVDLETGKRRGLSKHSDDIRSVAIRWDGRQAISGSSDRTMRLWDLQTAKCLRILRGFQDHVASVVLTPDGRRTLCATHNILDDTFTLWDLSTGACLQVFAGHHAPVVCVAATADGRRALSGSEDSTLKLWDLKTGACLRTFEGHGSSILAIAPLPDSRFAVTGSKDTTLRLWNLEQGRCLRVFEAHKDQVNRVVVSRDGRRMLSASRDGVLLFWELDWDYEFPDMAAWDDRLEPYLDVFIQQHLPPFNEIADPSRSVSWSEDNFDGLIAALGRQGFGWVRPEAVLQFLAETWAELQSDTAGFLNAVENARLDQAGTLFRHAIYWAPFDPGGEMLALWRKTGEAHGRRVDMLGSRCFRVLAEGSSDVTAVAITDDGTLAMTGTNDAVVYIWDVESGRRTRTLKGHKEAVTGAALSRDGTRAVSGSADGSIRLFSLGDKVSNRSVAAHEGGVTAIAISPDGRRILSGGKDSAIRLWDFESGNHLLECIGHEDPIEWVGFSSGGHRFFSIGKDHCIRFWEGETGGCLQIIESEDRIVSLTQKPDGPVVYATAKPQEALFVRQQAGGELLGTCTGNEYTPCGAAVITSDAAFLVAPADEGRLGIWALGAGQSAQEALHHLKGHRFYIHSLRATPDGRFLISGGADSTARIWELDWDYAF